ncbi:MAG: hypothetical protein IPM59_02220 [Chloracidobacterium sp.]|nr:hypothetical protein [Chloracidobacterium sp.]
MARPLVLSLDGQEFSVSIRKIDRDMLYGSMEIEAFDEKGDPADLLVLAADGKTLLDKGGTALATLDEKGNSIERNTLKSVNLEGKELDLVESSFSKPNKLKKADVNDYLAQLVKSVYLLDPYEDGDIDYLLDHLSAGLIYRFPFSYRGGTEYDNAFVVGNGSDAFMIIGKQANFHFSKLNQVAKLDATEEQDILGDDIDFDLF